MEVELEDEDGLTIGGFIREEDRRREGADVVTCMVASIRMVVVGTAGGAVWVLDTDGNLLQAWEGRHLGGVAALAVHGEAIVSVGRQDGMMLSVVIEFSGERKAPATVISHRESAKVRAVALDPRGSPAHRFAFGDDGGRVALVSRGWLGEAVTIIRRDAGLVSCLEWRGSLLAWVESDGLRVYDVESQRGVCLIPAPSRYLKEPVQPSPSLHGIEHEDHLFLVSWGSVAKVVALRRPLAGARNLRGWDVQTLSAGPQIEGYFNADPSSRCCGCVPFSSNGIAVWEEDNKDSTDGSGSLAWLAQRTDVFELVIAPTKPGAPANKRIVKLDVDPDHVSDCGIIAVPGGEPLVLIWFKAKDPSKIISPISFVRRMPPSEIVASLMEQGDLVRALAAARQARAGPLRRAGLNIVEIAERYLESLWKLGDTKTLLETLPDTIELMGKHSLPKASGGVSERWEEWVDKFVSRSMSSAIVDSVPTLAPRLPRRSYDEILRSLIDVDADKLHSVLQRWPSDLYTVSTVTQAVEVGLASDPTDKSSLKESLLLLYSHSGRHDETLGLLLEEKSDRAFTYIESHGLLDALRDEKSMVQLFEISKHKAAELLARTPSSVLPVSSVVSLLEKLGHRDWLHAYLDAIFHIEESAVSGHHELLIDLYCEFGPRETLMHLLMTSTQYSPEVVLRIISGAMSRNLGRFESERVYLLGRIGDAQSALEIIVHELDDVDLAIEFAESQGDPSLWNTLVEHARGDGKFLSALLDHSSGRIDPVSLLHLITPEMEVPCLRRRLQRLFIDAILERNLQEGCAKVLLDEVETRAEEYRKLLAKPITSELPPKES